jgi:hypothetical protein
MRTMGALLTFVALCVAGYALFALGWDGGTSRIWGDYMLLAIAAVVAVGGLGALARQAWGLWLGFGVLAALLLLATMAPLL